ncbi:MAG: uncharacterized protein PWP23_3276 [Candidatus Sumerlaeota bacterium]|nr:uncharacterized protein [Candidatus Sumerlaeota bacterium]
MLKLVASSDGALLALRVQPNAKRTALAGLYQDSLKISLQAPAVDGKANAALIAFLAKLAGTARSNVRIVRGETSRSKTVRFDNLTVEALRAKLAEAGVNPQDLP